MTHKKRSKSSYLIFGVLAIVALLGINSYHPIFNLTTWSPNNDVIVSPVTVQKTISTASYQGDVGSKINQANTACGAVGCQIDVVDSGAITTPVILSDNRVLNLQGTYTVAAIISPGSTNEIKGQGMDKTVLTRDPNFFAGKGADERPRQGEQCRDSACDNIPEGDFNQIVNAEMFSISNKNKVIIHDLALDGNTQGVGYYLIEGCYPKCTGKDYHMPKGDQPEIKAKGSSDISIIRIKATNVQTNAISAVSTNHLLIRDCDISSDGWNKYQLVFVGVRDNKDLLVKHNYIHGSSHAGLFIAGTDGYVVDDNLIDRNRVNTFFTGPGGQIGLQYDAIHGVIKNNKITNAGYTPGSELPKRSTKDILGHGITIDSQYVVVTGNEIAWNAGTGINVHDNIGVYLAAGKPIPVGLTQTDHITIENNNIHDNGIPGKAENSGINLDPGVETQDIVLRNNGDDDGITSFSVVDLDG